MYQLGQQWALMAVDKKILLTLSPWLCQVCGLVTTVGPLRDFFFNEMMIMIDEIMYSNDLEMYILLQFRLIADFFVN